MQNIRALLIETLEKVTTKHEMIRLARFALRMPDRSRRHAILATIAEVACLFMLAAGVPP